jgi:putative cardiolipin synthase
MRSAQQEVLVISPYFVPGPEGSCPDARTGRTGRAHPHSDQFAGLHRFSAGAQRLCPLPSSAAQTRCRALRSAAQARDRNASAFIRSSSSNASLHAKALVIDQKTVFIGSMNMDARSARTNSEMGIVMRSAEIARRSRACSTTSARTAATRCRSTAATISCGPAANRARKRPGIRIRKPRHCSAFLLKLFAPFAPEELL